MSNKLALRIQGPRYWFRPKILLVPSLAMSTEEQEQNKHMSFPLYFPSFLLLQLRELTEPDVVICPDTLDRALSSVFLLIPYKLFGFLTNLNIHSWGTGNRSISEHQSFLVTIFGAKITFLNGEGQLSTHHFSCTATAVGSRSSSLHFSTHNCICLCIC